MWIDPQPHLCSFELIYLTEASSFLDANLSSRGTRRGIDSRQMNWPTKNPPTRIVLVPIVCSFPLGIDTPPLVIFVFTSRFLTQWETEIARLFPPPCLSAFRLISQDQQLPGGRPTSPPFPRFNLFGLIVRRLNRRQCILSFPHFCLFSRFVSAFICLCPPLFIYL